MTTTLDLRSAKRLFYGGAEAQRLFYGSQLLWTKPVPSTPISTFYGTGAGQVPMDHKYAEGTKSGNNLTAVPNLGGAGSAFNLTTIGTVPVTGQVAELDPTDYFSLAAQADLVGVRFFMVADIHSTAANQYFGGQNEANGAGGKTNILLGSGGTYINMTKNTGSTVAAQVTLSPPVSSGVRLYEIEMISGGNLSVWVNGQQRGIVANPHTSLLINRIAAGQSTASGMNAGIYRTLSLITGGDYASRVTTIRARLNEQYGLGIEDPAASMIKLTDPAENNLFTVQSRTATSLAASRTSGSRSHFSYNQFIPAGSRIRFTSDGTGSIWVRLATDATLSNDVIDVLIGATGTQNVDFVVPSSRTWFGFLVASSIASSSINISNFRVDAP